MIERVSASNLSEFENFVTANPKGHFMQSSLWAKVKPNWKWEALLCRGNDGSVKGAVAVLIRKLPGLPYSLMYGGRAPVCDPHDKETLAELFDGLKKIAKEYKCYVIKLDPDIVSSDTEFSNIMKSLGFKNKSAGKNFEGIQPRYVFRLNVENKTEEELMQAFHPKTRYNIRVAIKKGVEVKIVGKEELPKFAEIMRTTGLRDGFVTRPLEYFQNMLEVLGEHARLYMAYSNGTAIAGTLAIHYGDKVWYLYGASANEYRNLMPNYLLQLEMIRWALECNCRIYDFRGVSGDISEDNPLYGLYKFKKGFSGDFTEFVGEFEYTTKPFIHFAIEKGSHIYREVRRKLYLLKNRKKEQKQ